MSPLERIEGGLARARAAIREAVRSSNYTSQKKENFIPRGAVYRNPYAFHQLSSHYTILLVKIHISFLKIVSKFPERRMISDISFICRRCKVDFIDLPTISLSKPHRNVSPFFFFLVFLAFIKV